MNSPTALVGPAFNLQVTVFEEPTMSIIYYVDHFMSIVSRVNVLSVSSARHASERPDLLLCIRCLCSYFNIMCVS